MIEIFAPDALRGNTLILIEPRGPVFVEEVRSPVHIALAEQMAESVVLSAESEQVPVSVAVRTPTPRRVPDVVALTLSAATIVDGAASKRPEHDALPPIVVVIKPSADVLAISVVDALRDEINVPLPPNVPTQEALPSIAAPNPPPPTAPSHTTL